MERRATVASQRATTVGRGVLVLFRAGPYELESRTIDPPPSLRRGPIYLTNRLGARLLSTSIHSYYILFIANDIALAIRFAREMSDGALPKVLKDLRERLGSLSQEQLAHRLGVTYSTVNRWENARALPSPLARQKLNELLKEARLAHLQGTNK